MLIPHYYSALHSIKRKWCFRKSRNKCLRRVRAGNAGCQGGWQPECSGSGTMAPPQVLLLLVFISSSSTMCQILLVRLTFFPVIHLTCSSLLYVGIINSLLHLEKFPDFTYLPATAHPVGNWNRIQNRISLRVSPSGTPTPQHWAGTPLWFKKKKKIKIHCYNHFRKLERKKNETLLNHKRKELEVKRATAAHNEPRGSAVSRS